MQEPNESRVYLELEVPQPILIPKEEEEEEEGGEWEDSPLKYDVDITIKPVEINV